MGVFIVVIVLVLVLIGWRGKRPAAASKRGSTNHGSRHDEPISSKDTKVRFNLTREERIYDTKTGAVIGDQLGVT